MRALYPLGGHQLSNSSIEGKPRSFGLFLALPTDASRLAAVTSHSVARRSASAPTTGAGKRDFLLSISWNFWEFTAPSHALEMSRSIPGSVSRRRDMATPPPTGVLPLSLGTKSTH